jgi:uncharacterized protein
MAGLVASTASFLAPLALRRLEQTRGWATQRMIRLTTEHPHFLYLHGFRSSPKSFKAQRMRAWLATHRPELRVWIPQLPPSPRDAMALIESGIAGWPAQRSMVMGSSLGGFYATVVAQRTGWPAVLINPVVDPARDLAAAIGEQTAFHTPNERFHFRAEYLDDLRRMTPGVITRPDRLLAVIAKGDEVLDWREMTSRYRDANVRLVEGSDLATILQFLKLCD